MWGTETITWVTRACSDQWFFTACTGTSSRFLSKLFFFQMRNGTRGTEKWRRKSEKTKQKGRASIGELVSRVFPRVSIFRITEVTHFAADHWSPVKRWRSTGFGLDSSSSSSSSSSSFLSLRSTAAVEGRGRSQRGGGTVPQEGDVFVNFEMFRMSIFWVCLIHLCYSTRVLSIKTFPTELLLNMGIF